MAYYTVNLLYKKFSYMHNFWGSGDDVTLSAFSIGDKIVFAGYSKSLERLSISLETKDLWVIEVEKSKSIPVANSSRAKVFTCPLNEIGGKTRNLK